MDADPPHQYQHRENLSKSRSIISYKICYWCILGQKYVSYRPFNEFITPKTFI